MSELTTRDQVIGTAGLPGGPAATATAEEGTTTAPAPRGRLGWTTLVVLVAAVAACTVLLFQPLVPEAKGTLTIAIMMLLLALGVPVAVSMGVAGILGIYALTGLGPTERTLMDAPFSTLASWTLSVLPMFIFMGIMLWSSGATDRLYAAARHWLGWLPGGLAITTNVAGAGLAAASGSTVGITHAVARIGVPEMLRSGYDRRLVLGSVLMSGMSGQLIPPSVLLVVYAGVSQVAVGPQLLAGFLPGVLLAATACASMALLATLRPTLAPRTRLDVTWAMRWRSAAAALPVPVLSALVIGGLLVGVFTATEAGAFGALGALVIGAVLMRPRDWARATTAALRLTVSSVGQIMFLVLGTAILGRAIALSGVPVWLVAKVEELGLSRLALLLLLVAFYLLLGAFLDPVAMILLTVPFLLPVLAAVEIDLIWFGVFVVLMAELGMVTPPVGILSYVVYRLVQDPAVRGTTVIRLSHVFVGGLWMLPVALAVVALLIAFPGITSVLSGG